MQGNVLGQASSNFKINGIIEEYIVASNENVRAGDFVKYIDSITQQISQKTSSYTDDSDCLFGIALSNDKVLILRTDTGSLYGTLCLIDEINNTISIKYNQRINTLSYPNTFSAVSLTEDTIFVSSADGINAGSSKLYGTIYKISNTDITTVTNLQLSNTGCIGKNSTLKLSDNKIFIAQCILKGVSENDCVNGFICTIDNNNSIITLDDTITISQNEYGIYEVSACVLSDNRIFVAYCGDSTFKLYARICTINENSIELSTETCLNSNRYTGRNIYTLSLVNNSVFLMYPIEYSSNKVPYVEFCTIDINNNISIKSGHILDTSGRMSDTHISFEGVIKISNSEVMCFYCNSTSYLYMKSILIRNNVIYDKGYASTGVKYSRICPVKMPQHRVFRFGIENSSTTTFNMSYLDIGGIAQVKTLSDTILGIAKTKGQEEQTIQIYTPKVLAYICTEEGNQVITEKEEMIINE